MTALTFLEWVLENSINHMTVGSRVLKVANFYNQPFSTNMLVNPHKEVEGVDDGYSSLYYNSESLRLFDGWEINGELSYLHISNNRHTIIADFLESAITFRENDNYECNEYYFYCGYDNITLNDFITLCNLAGIDLQFNESNETIKKLFRKEGDTK